LALRGKEEMLLAAETSNVTMRSEAGKENTV
jgi:hypothetical protein